MIRLSPTFELPFDRLCPPSIACQNFPGSRSVILSEEEARMLYLLAEDIFAGKNCLQNFVHLLAHIIIISS